MKCPICHKSAKASAFAPFCSERCRLVDLDNWMSGRYTIPAVEEDMEDDPEPPTEVPEENDA